MVDARATEPWYPVTYGELMHLFNQHPSLEADFEEEVDERVLKSQCDSPNPVNTVVNLGWLLPGKTG